MIKNFILLSLLLIVTYGSMAQEVFPYLDNRDYFKSFHEGRSTQLDHLKPIDVKFSEHIIAFIDNKSDLIIFDGVKRSEEHTSELQSRPHLVCRLLLEKKKRI